MKNTNIGRYWTFIAMFFSGMAGLIYEIVWLRQLVLVFGSTTRSMVVVISTFMVGLALGSWFFGKKSQQSDNPIKLYATLELIVGSGALVSQGGIVAIEKLYKILDLGNMHTGEIVVRFLLVSLVLLLPTFMMGGTLPAMVNWIKRFGGETRTNLSRLYAINTWGAFWGVILTNWLLIEWLGLRGALVFGVLINFLIGGISLWIGNYVTKEKIKEKLKKASMLVAAGDRRRLLFIYAISGGVALGYQVLWTRVLTPAMGTFVYSFATILALYLIGIVVGSFLFEKIKGNSFHTWESLAVIQLMLGGAGIISVVINSGLINISGPVRVLATILPGTILMGLSFPLVNELVSRTGREGEDVGIVYGANTLGTVVGSYVTAFVIIPLLGTAKGVLLLGGLNVLLAAWLGFRNGKKNLRLLGMCGGVILGLLLIWGKGNLLEARTQLLRDKLIAKGGYQMMALEDEVASVFGYSNKEGTERELIIDGVPTTNLGPETTLLGHLPLGLNPQAKRMLVVAFGMGTTYHSALLHEGVKVDAVELVPSVPKMVGLFHKDASQLLDNPNGNIIINDGRNYIKWTKERYDVVVVDPPPPVNASGTTVLYSQGFYEDIKRKLNPGGMVVVWFYIETGVDDYRMLWKSFNNVFDNILVFKAPTGLGYYLVGSNSQIDYEGWYNNWDVKRMLTDVNQGNTEKDQLIDEKMLSLMYVGDKQIVESFVGDILPVTDDRPRTEYYWWRKLTPEKSMKLIDLAK